ncbi:MAG TPA: sterol desaturase family protein [Rhizomicrobium sp.]|jgi:sterol desaturase/sphingolipid hydroxylase (fatty acid hydroxylase superfamily)|nr:sterol desaturase family protein [Rhizomicrobium sp.]
MTAALFADIVNGFAHTLLRVLPYMAVMGVVFAVLTALTPCNPGQHWWRKKGLVTDLCYWFIVPVFTRYGRIGFSVLITVYLLGINTAQGIIHFFEYGHGPVARLPFWAQFALYLFGTEFLLYWSHRMFHSSIFWKYHAVHHASEEVDWTSAARFHPVNLLLGTVLVDTLALLAGFNPDIFLIMAPFDTLTSGWVHANLNWTLGPLKYVIASPVFHRWHHTREVKDVNFAGTFSIFDLMFGTFYMPKGELPQNFGIEDEKMPESFGAQLLYPIRS